MFSKSKVPQVAQHHRTLYVLGTPAPAAIDDIMDGSDYHHFTVGGK